MIDAHILQSHSLFGGITDKQMEGIIPYLKEESFQEGALIVKEGDDGDRIYFIAEGSVEILKARADDHQQPQKIAELHTGDAFGEMELIDIQRRAATVRALEPVSAITLSNRDLYTIYHKDIKAYTIILLNLAREISRRLRKMDQQVANLQAQQQ